MYFNNGQEIIEEGFIEDFREKLELHKNISELQQNVINVNKNKLSDTDEMLKGRLSESIHTLSSKIKISESHIIIKGINFTKFFQRIKNYYSENNFSKIFIRVFTPRDIKLWEKGKIQKKDMTIKELSFPVFFALEVAMIFEDLGVEYNVGHYLKIARNIRTKTWLKELHKPDIEVNIDLSKLKNIKYELKPYQYEFVKLYPTIKRKFNLDGYLLSFDQGLGKTLTSVALAECLSVDQVVIVCPNSLKENWSYEIKEYFNKYKNEKLWKEEVFVHGNSRYNFTKKTKYIIVNFEAISQIINKVNSKKSTLLIVDEMHNVRNINGKRTKDLIDLRRKLSKIDVLLMSGTPIKATPNEIIPSLILIDPLFTDEAADIYNKCFKVDGAGTKNIVNARFGMVMHRKTKKEVLSLPEKKIHNLYLGNISKSYRYEVNVVKHDTSEVVKRLLEEELPKMDGRREVYVNLIKKYHKAPRKDLDEYLEYLYNPQDISSYSEVEIERINNFVEKYVEPNIYYPPDIKNFKEAKTAYIHMLSRINGKAMGEVLHPRRRKMFIDLYEYNKKEIIEMIQNSTKKTVIFSTLLEVVNYISYDLDRLGIKNVKIVGSTSNRMDEIQKFKNDDSIDVLIATSQTLSTGVTLTEANQMFFFGTPWRSADFDQCCDRIYRIGQNTDVDIYNVLLDTGDKLNLSTRMNDILSWSNDMFNNMVEGNFDGENL